MRLIRIIDTTIDEVSRNEYDLGIFATGYEYRAKSLALKLDRNKFNKVLVLGFLQENYYRSRNLNDVYFKTNWVDEINLVSSSDDGILYSILNKLDFIAKKDIKILIDYSSMSRLWYSAILNWIKFINKFKSVTIDFCYSAGEYKNEIQPLLVNKISTIPGCEGSSMNAAKSVSVFGLGFDGNSTLWVLDKLESDLVFAYYADPSVYPDYPERTLKSNSEFLKEHVSSVIKVPLLSCENTFRYLGELVAGFISNTNITLVPMGPKPHILAAILLCFRFNEISCLYVEGTRKRNDFISPSGYFSVSRVFFHSND